MKSILLLLFLIKTYYCFNAPINNILSKSLIASSLIYNPIQETTYMGKYHKETIQYEKNDNTDFFKSASIKMERNNIYLYGPITDESCTELKNKLNDLDFNGRLFKLEYNKEPPPINLHIKSYGGSLMDTLYVVDLIENLDTEVNTYVDGYCASAATLLSVVGKNRYMSANSLILIHQLYSGYEGKYEELSDSMINTNNLMKKIKKIYLKHTNIKENELNEILKHDLWLDAETSLKYGLVDKIII